MAKRVKRLYRSFDNHNQRGKEQYVSRNFAVAVFTVTLFATQLLQAVSLISAPVHQLAAVAGHMFCLATWGNQPGHLCLDDLEFSYPGTGGDQEVVAGFEMNFRTARIPAEEVEQTCLNRVLKSRH